MAKLKLVNGKSRNGNGHSNGSNGGIKLWNGQHLLSCECRSCLTNRLASYNPRFQHMLQAGVLPPDPEHPVPVKAYWRRQDNFLNRSPKLKAAYFAELREMMRERKKRHA